MKKMLKKWARTGTETRDDIYDKLGGAGGGSKFSRSNKIKEVQTKPKKSLKNQKPTKSKLDKSLKESEGIPFPKHGDSTGARKKSLLETYPKGSKTKSNKIKEVQTKQKKSLKNQKPAKNKEDEFLKEFEGKSLPKHGDYMGPRKKSLLQSKVKGRKDYEDLFGPWLKKDL